MTTIKKTAATVEQDRIYRTYWIRHNHLNGYIWVEKDGQRIASCNSTKQAEHAIDYLMDNEI